MRLESLKSALDQAVSKDSSLNAWTIELVDNGIPLDKSAWQQQFPEYTIVSMNTINEDNQKIACFVIQRNSSATKVPAHSFFSYPPQGINPLQAFLSPLDSEKKGAIKELQEIESPYLTVQDIEHYAQQKPEALKSIASIINSNPAELAQFEPFLTAGAPDLPRLCAALYLKQSCTLERCVSIILLFCALKQIKSDSSYEFKTMTPLTLDAVKELYPDEFDYNKLSKQPHFYQISYTLNQNPNIDSFKKYFCTQFATAGFGSFIPDCFSMKRSEIIIPSMEAMQNYLNNKYDDNAIKLIPRLGCASGQEIINARKKHQHILGLDPENKQTADDKKFGQYGFSLHDLYHALILSSIPRLHREYYLSLGDAMMEYAHLALKKGSRTNEQNKALLEMVFRLYDMDFPHYFRWNINHRDKILYNMNLKASLTTYMDDIMAHEKNNNLSSEDAQALLNILNDKIIKDNKILEADLEKVKKKCQPLMNSPDIAQQIKGWKKLNKANDILDITRSLARKIECNLDTLKNKSTNQNKLNT